jgi:F-type H+-transporting ATPase subunit delta
MISGSLARRYARALMSIGVDDNSYEKLGREVRDLAGAMHQSSELTDVLGNPAFPRAEREKVLLAVLRRLAAGPVVQNFTRLLLERERLGRIPDISRELDAMIDDRAGRVAAEVTTAAPLSPAQLGQLKTALEKLSGKTVQMEKHEDPAILGGVVAKVGDIVYDGSLRTQLERLRDQLR